MIITSFTISDNQEQKWNIKSEMVNSLFFENVPVFKKKKYHKDATRLALRYLAKGTDYAQMGTSVPKEVIDEIYYSLLSVYQSPFKESVEVTKNHKLHTFPNPAVDKFQVNYLNNVEWAVPLKLGDTSTDHPLINQLCEKHNLIIDAHQNWDDKSNIFIVKAKNAVNIAPIAEEFASIDGVDFVKLLIPKSDGNDIEAFRTAKGWRLDYMIKFDGCFTGCKKKHVWSFEISNIKDGKGNVNFLGETGDELPEWMKY